MHGIELYRYIILTDCRKLDEWKTILADDLSSQTWFESSSSSSEAESTDDSDGDENDSEVERMEIDEN